MRAVIQRVTSASVTVDGREVGRIGNGLLILLGVRKGDSEKDADYLVEKIIGLRIFQDSESKMNLSLADIGGALLIVSQFTLYGDTRKGRRPSFDEAAPAELARSLYDYFVRKARTHEVAVEEGVFQAHMDIALRNSGPVTLIVDSPG